MIFISMVLFVNGSLFSQSLFKDLISRFVGKKSLINKLSRLLELCIIEFTSWTDPSLQSEGSEQFCHLTSNVNGLVCNILNDSKRIPSYVPVALATAFNTIDL